jgi:putative transposase
MLVGWSMAQRATTDLVVGALVLALSRRQPTTGAICHADQGPQGGFNWWSQHLDRGGVDGQASRLDERVDGSVADEVAGSAVASAGGGAGVLA